ncbi:MAG: 6,7-dimethyl-8-ribityllumazine synthase, partial [Deltaproteobacteria bacterium]
MPRRWPCCSTGSGATGAGADPGAPRARRDRSPERPRALGREGPPDELLRGASDVLSAHGAEFDVVSVPGALEVPGAIAQADEAHHSPAGVAYDGYVALG